MAEAPQQNRALFREVGQTGLNIQSGNLYDEFLRNLTGQSGVATYYEMSCNSPIIGAILFIIEQMIQQVKWEIKPFSDDPQDQEPADFISECFEDMSQSWSDMLGEILTFLPYGWALMEIVYKMRLGQDVTGDQAKSKFNDRKIGWRKWALRGQNTLSEWAIDESGGIVGMVQQTNTVPYQKILIPLVMPSAEGQPLQKSLLFRTRVEKNNPEGFSILRRAYRPWWYAKRMEEIEAIGIERDLAGLPVLKPPENVDLWNPNDAMAVQGLAAATKLVQGVRRGEREGIVLPFNWTLELLSSGSRRQFDLNQTIERYETRMAMTCAADFIFLGMKQSGSWALSTDKTEMFLLALGGYLTRIDDIINQHAIPPLLELNGMDSARPPQRVHGSLETPDLQKLATYLSALTGAGAIQFPDEELENYLRLLAGFPPAPEEELPPAEAIDQTPEEVQQRQKFIAELVTLRKKYANGRGRRRELGGSGD